MTQATARTTAHPTSTQAQFLPRGARTRCGRLRALAGVALLLVAAPAAAGHPPQDAASFSPAGSSGMQAIGALIAQSPPAEPEGNAVDAPVFAENQTPPFDPDHPSSLRFALHGFFRAPLRLSAGSCKDAATGLPGTCVRTPWLVDDDYFHSGFQYTRNPESDWTELYLMAGNAYLTATVGLAGSLFSDPARPIIDKQLGISQGFVTFRHDVDATERVKLRLKIKGGAFSDRFGWQEKYDTYLFGRTHQMGEQVRADLDMGKFTLTALQGFGAHLEAIESNQGLSMINYLRLGASYDKTAELALYYVRTWTNDKRQLKEITDANMLVLGVEARVDTFLGRMQLALSTLSAEQAKYLSPSLEIMHSQGGNGLTENYLGTDKSNNGTGSLLNLGFQYDVSAARLLKKLTGSNLLGEADVNLSAFGLYTQVGSDQKDTDPVINRDGRKLWKWGSELAVWPLSFLGASVRYDRVTPDESDEASAFRIVSPRLSVRTHWIPDGLIFLQWSHYLYGRRVALRQGQIPLETQPDTDMIKIQAQMAF